MRERGVHRKATFEDRFYRHWCCGKVNHPENWSKDKHMNRKALRRWLKNEQRKEERDD
jgi:hypothetical protein